MDKKPLTPILREQYKRLEEKENTLRRQFSQLRSAKIGAIKYIVTRLYHSCTVGDKVNYRRLFEPITKQEAIELQFLTEKAKRGAVIDGFPFSVLHFDRLNRLEASKLSFVVNEIEQANDLYALLTGYMHEHIYASMMAVAGALAIEYSVSDKRVDEIAENPDQPILKALQQQHYNTAIRGSQMLQQAITRGDSADKAIKLITEYTEKRDKNTDDRLIFTEDTRATCEAAADVIKPYVKSFYTVNVHDGKQCADCVAIEREQMANPVPFAEYRSGITAPPFHPFCRCGIEVIWVENDKDI